MKTNFEQLSNAWDRLPKCTKISFFTFGMAKLTFISTVSSLVIFNREVSLVSFGFYIFFYENSGSKSINLRILLHVTWSCIMIDPTI